MKRNEFRRSPENISWYRPRPTCEEGSYNIYLRLSGIVKSWNEYSLESRCYTDVYCGVCAGGWPVMYMYM